MDTRDHWEAVYAGRDPGALSWFQPCAERSLALIRATGLAHDAAILDVGGGASTLVDALLSDGYRNLGVLDVSASALAAARRRLGADRAAAVRWIEADILFAGLPERSCDLWHDRAVFHFLTEAAQRRVYTDLAQRVIRPGGYLVIATFAEDGPERCSGLPVRRYGASSLQAEFGAGFELLREEREIHCTPGGAEQRFLYCVFRRRASV